MHGLDFNIEVTGFEIGETDLRIASLDEPPERDDDPADAVPEVSGRPGGQQAPARPCSARGARNRAAWGFGQDASRSRGPLSAT